MALSALCELCGELLCFLIGMQLIMVPGDAGEVDYIGFRDRARLGNKFLAYLKIFKI
jgi:hypothetical protein